MQQCGDPQTSKTARCGWWWNWATLTPRLLVKRCLQKMDTEALRAEHTHICGASDMDHMTKAQRMQLILDKSEANGTFKHQQAEWERQARTGCHQSSVHNVCKTTWACSMLGSSAAMLTMVKSVKTLTKSVAVARLDNQNRTQAGQGTWKCGPPAEFIDGDQMTLQELMALKRMPHTTLDGNHHNRQLWIVSSWYLDSTWYCPIKVKISGEKKLMNKTPDHDMSQRWRDDITSNPTRDSRIEAYMLKNVEQVPVKKRNELGRHGYHERDDPWTWHISRAKKKSPSDNTTYKLWQYIK